jgi:DNA-binding XRE family transcriptional regulator
MAKKNKLSTSIVRTKAVQAKVVPRDRGQDEAEFKTKVAQFIEQKIAEAMANGSDAQFQPWFQPQEIAYEIKRRQTVTEQQKWVLYFKDWGCIVCSPIAGRVHKHVIDLDNEKIAELRKQGLSWPNVAKQIGVSETTIYKFRNGERPEAPEIGNSQHRSLGMCTTCYQRVANRLESTLQKHAPAPSRIEPTFVDSVRLAREALAPSLAALHAEGAKDRRNK